MNTSKLSPRTFTLRQANQMLPLVQSIAEDIVELAKEVEQTRQRLKELGAIKITRRDAEEIYHDEVESIEDFVREQTERISSYEAELSELGLHADRVKEGYVEFAAIRLNEPVFLTWKLGEPEVRYWRQIDETCEQRRLVDLELIRQSGGHAIF